MRKGDSSATGWPYHLLDFVEHVLVECPKCSACAVVECVRGIRGTPKLTCPECAFTKRGWPPPSAIEIRRCARGRCPRCKDSLSKATARFIARKRTVEVLCPCDAVTLVSWPSASMRVGEPLDPYFHLPLWLRSDTRGETVWAYNREHLAFLEAYLRATLRQRSPNHNGSLVSRLPGWMKVSAIRQDVLKAISRASRR